MHSAILVDDEQFVRLGLRALIDWEAAGFHIIGEADNGEDALALIDRLKPDLVVTDIRMPVLDGLELIRRTRAGQSTLEGSATSFIIISGFDDFKYAQQAVRYGVSDFLLKPIDEKELTSALKRLDEELSRDKVLRGKKEQLVNGSVMEALIKGEMSEAEVDVWAARLGIERGARLYYMFIEPNDLHPWYEGDIVSFDDERIVHAVKGALISVLGRTESPYVHRHRNRFGVVISAADLAYTGGEIGRFAERLLWEVEQRVDRPFYIYVGQQVEGLHMVGAAYQSAREALQYKYMEDEPRIIIHHPSKYAPAPFVHADPQLIKSMLEHLEERNAEELQQAIDALFEQFRAKRFVPAAVKAAIHQCVSGIVSVLQSVEVDAMEMNSAEPIISWHDLNLTPSELKRLFQAFVAESAGQLASRRKELAKGGVQKVKAFIEANYRENMSLKSIAARFFMNPVYLGQLFKKTYGVYFNDFLLQLRVEEAKRLLRKTDLRIYEVAEQVGFNNADYFVTQFEKLERMTPSEYRNKLL
ncbi:response regulator transcription factor [Paenibacillus xylaniclasticus]|uniref:response regulator transcription factor n=1 Tax=Paenibacillus xylaniclasticus TaxID=588083 RepID=UPI000FDC0583|nr:MULTISPECIES: response regulator transcription factor [Paenibacillus]GFN33327.1 AraC family transcriptional regulator [Paenibacillus curdlanolyticus]